MQYSFQTKQIDTLFTQSIKIYVMNRLQIVKLGPHVVYTYWQPHSTLHSPCRHQKEPRQQTVSCRSNVWFSSRYNGTPLIWTTREQSCNLYLWNLATNGLVSVRALASHKYMWSGFDFGPKSHVGWVCCCYLLVPKVFLWYSSYPYSRRTYSMLLCWWDHRDSSFSGSNWTFQCMDVPDIKESARQDCRFPLFDFYLIDISVDNSSIIAIRLAVDLVFGCIVLRHHGWFLKTSRAPQDSEFLRFWDEISASDARSECHPIRSHGPSSRRGIELRQTASKCTRLKQSTRGIQKCSHVQTGTA